MGPARRAAAARPSAPGGTCGVYQDFGFGGRRAAGERRGRPAHSTGRPRERRGHVRGEAKIILWEATNAVKAPAGALFRHGEQWAAFVVANGGAELRVVKAGRSNGIEMQVLEGLREGEEVAIYPGSRVRQGQRVRTIKI